MPVAIDIRPDFDAFADDTLHGKAAAVDQRVNIFDMESAAYCGALDSLSCFVHGDATDMEMTSRFICGKRDASNLYTKPLDGHWFPGNALDGRELNTAILFLHLENFVTFPAPCRANSVPNGPFHQSCRPRNSDRIYRRAGSPACDGCGRPEDHPRCPAGRIAAPAAQPAGGGPVRPALADRTRAGCHVSGALENRCRS